MKAAGIMAKRKTPKRKRVNRPKESASAIGKMVPSGRDEIIPKSCDNLNLLKHW